MTKVTVGKWGKNLAVRLPADVARAAGITSGESVEVVARDGDILITRMTAEARADAEAAAEEIIADAERYSLDGLTIRELIDEGRR